MSSQEGHEKRAFIVENKMMETSFEEGTVPVSDKNKTTIRNNDELLYSVTDTPPWYLSLLLGLQHYMTAFSSTLTVPLVIAGPLCVGSNLVGLSELIATIFFASGIATLLQTCLGIRLPIIQGATFAFLVPTLSILSQPEWACPSDSNQTTAGVTEANENFTLTEEGADTIWHSRMREIQGAICVASIVQILIGASGLLSLVLCYVGPLTIAPTITLIGLSLFRVAADKAATYWPIAVMTFCLVALCSQYLSRLNIPLPVYRRRIGFGISRQPLFKLFPILIAMLSAWLFCFILTVSDVFPSNPSEPGYLARTDVRIDVIKKSVWIRVPYPGQWGLPTVSAGSVLGMLAGVLASMIESVGDYYACARLARAPPPPPRAVNRGIMVEGIGCIIAGLLGSGNGTTSYSENVAAIGITRVASRRVVQAAGIMLIVFGCVGKIGAIFITIPDPVVGGMFLSLFAMVAGVGLSNLQYVDLNSTRNIFVLACALFLGLAVPDWLERNPDAIDINIPTLRQTIRILLTTSMFVGGVVGFILDSTMPGTLEERGITAWRDKSKSCDDHGESRTERSIYDLPFMSNVLRRQKWIRYVPFCIDPK